MKTYLCLNHLGGYSSLPKASTYFIFNLANPGFYLRPETKLNGSFPFVTASATTRPIPQIFWKFINIMSTLRSTNPAVLSTHKKRCFQGFKVVIRLGNQTTPRRLTRVRKFWMWIETLVKLANIQLNGAVD